MTLPSPNPSACQTARESLIGHIGPSGDSALSAQEFHCEACQAWFERARTQARAMNVLQRQVAEQSTLDGRVVAGLNAGYRQERATAALESLARRKVPDELADRVRENLGRMIRAAPEELEMRVANELIGSAGPRVERQLSGLIRLTAPAELELRVVRDLSRSARSDALPLRRWVAIAATLIVVVGAASLARQAGRFGASKPYEFRVTHTASLASMDREARSWLSAFSGAVLEGEQR